MAQRVHVLGGGALGTLWAAHLAHSGVPTTLLLRHGSARRVPVRVTPDWDRRGEASELETSLPAEASTGPGSRISMLMLATKAYDARQVQRSMPRHMRGGLTRTHSARCTR